MRDVFVRWRHGRRDQAGAGASRCAGRRGAAGARCGCRARPKRGVAARAAYGGRRGRDRAAAQPRVAGAARGARARGSGPGAGGTAAQSSVRVLEQAQRRRHPDRPGRARRRRGAGDDAARARDRAAQVAQAKLVAASEIVATVAAARHAYVGRQPRRKMAAYAAQVGYGGSVERARAPDAAGRELEPLAQMREQASTPKRPTSSRGRSRQRWRNASGSRACSG